MNKISTRQLCFFLAAIAPVGKIILLPTQLVRYAENDLLFPAAMNFLLQAAVIFLVLLLAKNNKSFYELVAQKLGHIAAKIILSLFALFFFFAAVLPLIEQKLFVQSVFYDTLPSIVTFSSFFVLSAYLCAKPLASFSRTWDILAPLGIASFAGILLFSFKATDFGALSPALQSGGKRIFEGFAYSMSWFVDSAIVLAFLGKIDYKKGLPWKGALCYLAGAVGVLFFLAVFYGVFQDIAINQQFSFTKITRYFSGIETLGRFDYLFIFTLALVMAFYAMLPLQAGIDFLRQAFGSRQKRYLPAILSVAVNAVMLAMTLLWDYRYQTLNETVCIKLFWLFPVFCLLLPALALLLNIRRRRETQ